jgi:hypothetical protein
MKSDNLLRHIVVPLGIALLVYAVFYTGIEYRRTRNGPWQVVFTNDASGTPALLINEPKLAVTNLQITFPGATNAVNIPTTSMSFSQPRVVPYDLPAGKCVFMDTTFLPGTIVFDLFGHEIQLIPRVLTIDGKEIPWRSNMTIAIAGTNTLELQPKIH